MIDKPKANIDGWIKTDDNQFVKKISDTLFKVYDEITYGHNDEYTNIFYEEIDFEEYTDDELNGYVYGYYKNIDEVKEIYGSDWRMIVAEIIAEQSGHDFSLDDFENSEE